jgi:hypothetical protein
VTDPTSFSRRDVLRAAAAGLFAPLAVGPAVGRGRRDPPYAAFLGDALLRGHRVRNVDPTKLPVDSEREVDVLIVGAGFAGLSAATALERRGIDSFRVVELDDVPGGRAQRRKVGGAELQFGPVAFDGPALGRKTRADEDVAAFLDACGVATAPRKARIARQNDDGAFVEEDVRGEGAALLSAVSAAEADLEKGLLNAIDAETFGAKRAPRATGRLSSYCRARFGALAANLGAAPVVADLLSRGPKCGGLRLFPKGGPGAVAERAVARLSDRVAFDRVVLRVRTHPERGVVAHVIDPKTNRVERLFARFSILAAPPFVVAEIAPDLAADGRFAALPETSTWLETAIGLRTKPSAFPAGVDLAAPSLAHPTALAAWVPRIDPAPATFDPLHPEGFLLLKRPFVSAATTPARIFLSQTPPWDLRDYVFRDLERLFPDAVLGATRVDLLRVAHACARPWIGDRRAFSARLAAPRGPYFPCGADWTSTPSLFAAIADGARAGAAVADALSASAESRPR